MDAKIIETKENPFLNRKEFKIEVSYEGTIPSREEVKNTVIGKIGSSPELTVVEKINTNYGRDKVLVEVKVYNNKEDLLRYEPKHFLLRNKLIEDKKKEGGK